MRKSDASIRHIVTASIKRNSMYIKKWIRTQLWDRWSETIKLFIAKMIDLAPTELGIIGYLESDSYGYLITTQRVIIYEKDIIRSIKIDDIEKCDFGMNFKGIRGNQTETMTLQCKNGENDQFRFETGYPSMGTIYGLKTVLAVGKTKQ